MVSKKNETSFMPTQAIPPGETIKENMDFLGMSQKELALRLDMTPKHLCNILNGKAPITYETALKLESVIGPSAKFWINLENNYQLNKTRLEKQKELESDLEILKEIPYKKMSDYRWIEYVEDRIERVKKLREYFGVANLSLIKPSYDVMFRRQKHTKNISDLSVLSWLRKAELDGLSREVKEEFNRKKIKSLIPTFRKLTIEEPKNFYPEMVRLCAECGIALVVVEALPRTYICGATIWRNNKVILALSVRYKRADIFWFTFFHELAHLISHADKEFHISYENEEQEDEANILASNYLIPNEFYRKFINEYEYNCQEEIVDYALNIGVAPCILVGRMLHDGLIDYKDFNYLRPSFEIVRK